MLVHARLRSHQPVFNEGRSLQHIDQKFRRKGQIIFFTISPDVGIAVPRRMEVRIEESCSQTSLIEKNVAVYGATFSEEWLKSISNSLMFVSTLLEMPLTGLKFLIRILPYKGRSKKLQPTFELRGQSASFPFTMLLLSILVGFRLPSGVFFSGCLLDAEGWLARTDLHIVESKAKCLSDMKNHLNADNLAFYVPKWFPNNPAEPLETNVSKVTIWGIQNVLQCLDLVNPRIYRKLNLIYVKKFLSLRNLDLPNETIREIESASNKGLILLLADVEKRTSNKALLAGEIKRAYEQSGLRVSKVVDVRSSVDTSPVFVYLVAGGRIQLKELFRSPVGSPARSRIS